MRVTKENGKRRHVLTRVLVTSALLGTTFLVGVTTTASAAPPYHLVVAGEPSATDQSGAPLGVQPVIDIDNSGNGPQSGLTSNVTATITSGGVSVSAGTVAAVNGVASFTSLALNALVGSYTLTFSDATDSATSAVSNPIAVSLGAATQLKFAAGTTEPTGAVDTVALTPQPIVDVEDSGGNVVTSDSSSTVAAAFTSSGTTLANATKTVAAGVAAFSGFAITAPIDTINPGLTFTDGVLTPLVTDSIGITGPGTKLFIETAPSTTATNGVALTVQPVVQVEDTSGAVLKGDTSTVTAALVAGNVGSSITNDTKAAVEGVATFSGAAINAAPGSYSIIFTDGTLTSATTSVKTLVTVGAAAKLTVATQPSVTVAAGAALAIQPVVDITDSGGNLITSNTSLVTATLTTGTGTVVHGTATAIAGVATFVGLTLNALAAPYTLTFTDGALTTAVSTPITITVGGASQLVITTQPSTTVASGAALAAQPVVKVEDAGGNLIIGNSSTVTATVTTAAGTITNNTAVVSVTTGLATFSGLTLKELVGPYTLTFSDGALTTTKSTTVTVSAGVAAQLVITTQPSATVASGTVFAQVPVVKVEDSAGNVVTTDASTVTAKLTTGGVSVTPSTEVVTSGVATFTGFRANALVGPYTLSFTDGALSPATSASFAVTVGPASQLVVTTEPSTSTASALVLATQPVVKVEDSGGNVVTTATGTISAAIATGAGGTLSAGSNANIVAGVASFSGLALSGTPGTTYTLSFTGDALTVVDTAKIDVGLAQSALVVSTVRATYGRSFTLKTTGGSGTGAVTFVVANGSATGCAVSGSTLKSATAGTCIVTATKTNDLTYASIASTATTVTFAKLPIPHAVRLTFVNNSAALTGEARNALVSLVKKLTTHSVVSITGYAKGNTALAHRRAAAADKFLLQRLRVRVQLHWSSASAPQSVLIATKSQ